MARKPKLPEELKKQKKELVYNSLEECANEYVERIRNLCDETDFTMIRCNQSNYIENLFISPLGYFAERKRSGNINPDEILEAYNLLNHITIILSEKTRFQPTIFTFCKLLGISYQTFNNWTYENNEKGEVARQIQDRFKSIIVQGMLTGEYHPIAASFVGKATLGMKENDGNQTNINIVGTDMKLEDILADYQKNRK